MLGILQCSATVPIHAQTITDALAMHYTAKSLHNEISCGFGCFRSRFAELSAKDCVPEAARDAKA